MNDMSALWLNLYCLIVRPDAGNCLKKGRCDLRKKPACEVGVSKRARQDTSSLRLHSSYLFRELVEMQSETRLVRLLSWDEHKQTQVHPELLVSDEVPSYKCRIEGGALFFVACFEWFSSSPLMTTYQARGWENRAREGKSNEENRSTEWNQVTFFFFFFHSCTLKLLKLKPPGVRMTNYLFLCCLSKGKYKFKYTVATVHFYFQAVMEGKRLKDEMISSTFLKYQGR